jgi:hypothetical protein
VIKILINCRCSIVVASAKINRLLNDKMTADVAHLKAILASSRKVTLCIDGWTKKGLTSSFLGISACFFDTGSEKPQHALLNLDMIHHPHSGEKLCKCIESCLQKWDIKAEKVLQIVSDNGSNMIKAVSLLREGVYGQLSDEDVTMVNGQDDDSENEENDDDAEAGSVVDMTDLVYNIPYRRLGCLCHTLQLLIREVYNSDEYKEVLQSARKLVSKVRKSSVAMEKIVSKAGKTVINDNNTRWNCTFLMAQRLLQLRPHLNEILEEMKIDSLLNSEWVIIEQVDSLLEPFRQQTDILQTDACILAK